MENFGCHIFDDPISQGSRTIVKAFREDSVVGGKGRIGSKVKRKEASPLRCLTVKDIFESLNDAVEEISERHDTEPGYNMYLERWEVGEYKSTEEEVEREKRKEREMRSHPKEAI
jgi:hypothetical protein